MDGDEVQEVERLKLSRVLDLNKKLHLKVPTYIPAANFISSIFKMYPESDHFLRLLLSQVCSKHSNFSPGIL